MTQLESDQQRFCYCYCYVVYLLSVKDQVNKFCTESIKWHLIALCSYVQLIVGASHFQIKVDLDNKLLSPLLSAPNRLDNVQSWQNIVAKVHFCSFMLFKCGQSAKCHKLINWDECNNKDFFLFISRCKLIETYFFLNCYANYRDRDVINNLFRMIYGIHFPDV